MASTTSTCPITMRPDRCSAASKTGSGGRRCTLPPPEVGRIGRYARVDIALAERYVDDNGVEVIPTPGHTPGSTCYLVPGAIGLRYLFTGDTLYLSESGEWTAGYLPSFSNAHTLAESLRLLATLTPPDVVISSAYAGGFSGESRCRPGMAESHRSSSHRTLGRAAVGRSVEQPPEDVGLRQIDQFVPHDRTARCAGRKG